MRENPLADPAVDPLETERRSRKMTPRRMFLIAVGAFGAAAFAFGVVYTAVEFTKRPATEAAAGAQHAAEEVVD